MPSALRMVRAATRRRRCGNRILSPGVIRPARALRGRPGRRRRTLPFRASSVEHEECQCHGRRRSRSARRGAVVVRGRGSSRRRTEDLKLLRQDGPPVGFQETDTWRTLRIMGEFVEGFDALADIGPAVSIFGSARIGRRNRYYGAARRLAAALAQAGLRDHHRRRPRHHGGREPRRAGGAAGSRSAATSSSPSSRAQRVRRPRHGVPLLLRAQGDVREVRRRDS